MFLVDFTLSMFLNLLSFVSLPVFWFMLPCINTLSTGILKYLPEPTSVEPNGRCTRHLTCCCTWVYYPIPVNNITSLCIRKPDTFYFHDSS